MSISYLYVDVLEQSDMQKGGLKDGERRVGPTQTGLYNHRRWLEA